jgi:hypothetical protein
MSGLRRMVQRLAAPPELVCIGHSHIENVVAAAAIAGVALKSFNFWHYPSSLVHSDDKTELASEISSRLTAPLFSFVGGAVHQDVGLVVHPRPYDFTLPDRPDLPFAEGAESVPYEAVLAVMQGRTQLYLRIMGAIRRAIEGPMFHMQSPPIYTDEAVPENDAGWVDFFGGNRRIAPVWLRYKLWQVHSQIVRSYCGETGILFVPHPPKAVDAQGFMTERFHGTTAHANQAYGALVLRQMQDLASNDSLIRKMGRTVFG